jgi:hypothetical protein
VAGRCHDEAARSVLAKVRATSSHVFTQSPQNIAVEPGIHSLACWDLCFALPQLLHRWRYRSGIFWISPSTKWCIQKNTFISIRNLYTSRVFVDSVQVYLSVLHMIHKTKPIFFNIGISGLCLQRRSIPWPSLFA